MRTAKEFEEMLREALKGAGRYHSGLEPQIWTTAGAMQSLEMVNNKIAALDSVTIEGSHGEKGHPAFRMRKEAEDSVTRQLKALGLTAEALGTEQGEDPLYDLTKELQEIGPQDSKAKGKKGRK